MTQYKVTYYTTPGTVLTRQQVIATTLSQAESRAAYLYSKHRKNGPVHVWAKTRGEWEIIESDKNIERLILDDVQHQ